MTKRQKKDRKKGLRSDVALAAFLRGGGGPMGDRRLRRWRRRSWQREEL